MTRVIERQVAHHEYISRHLRGEAVDVRSNDMSSEQRKAFEDAVGHILGPHRLIPETDHLHLQF
jgi:hypothetical protein